MGNGPIAPPRIILCRVKKFLVTILHFSIHGSKKRLNLEILLDAVNISLVDIVNILDSYTQKDHSQQNII
jgi:hypothetical protein